MLNTIVICPLPPFRLFAYALQFYFIFVTRFLSFLSFLADGLIISGIVILLEVFEKQWYLILDFVGP